MNRLTRRSWLAGAGTLCATPEPAERPNVLFVMTDQQRFDALSSAGNRVIHTPNLDRLAAEGACFTEATCSSPLCGPSRASLLSGRYLHGHGCAGNFELDTPGMPESVETWDEVLAAHGYQVHYYGKWHTGSANRGHYAGGLRYYLEQYHEHLKAKYPGRERKADEAIDRYTKWPYRYLPVDRMMLRAQREGYVMPHHNEAGELEVKPEDTLTAWTVGRVIELLRRKPRPPFAVTCSILHPHAPLVAARPYFGLYDAAAMPMPKVLHDVFTPPARAAIPKILRLTPEGLGAYIALYYGLVREVDDWVGRLMGALEEGGYAGNTLVVFTSDHGEMLGEHARVSKMVFYEASIRVPLIFRFPGHIAKGRRLAVGASGADVAPTILDYLGVSAPGSMHGRSLRPAIEGRGAPPAGAYCELMSDPERPEALRILRSPEEKLAFRGRRAYLYDLKKDPLETRNLLDTEHRSPNSVERGRRLHQELLDRLEHMRSPERNILHTFRV